MLYKYCPLNINTIKCIANSEIYFSKASSFNDPFDSNASVKFDNAFYEDPILFFDKLFKIPSGEPIPQFFTEFRNEIVALFQDGRIEDIKDRIDSIAYQSNMSEADSEPSVSCFSKNHDNLLMWAHYADSHKGLVIGFDEAQYPFNCARKVNYPDDDFVHTFTIQEWENKFPDDILKPLFVKSKHWKYEEEYRIVLPQNPGPVKFNQSSLKEIYLGFRINDSMKFVKDLVNSTYPDAEIFYCSKDSRKYKVNPIKLLKI